MATKRCCIILLGVLALVAISCKAQDYDDDSYGGQGGTGGQADNDNYDRASSNGNYGNDDGYSGNMPNYQQNVDSDGASNNPNGQYSSQNGNGGSDADGDYEGDDSSAAASSLSPTLIRARRSTPESDPMRSTNINSPTKMIGSESEPKLRIKRHGKYYIGPVYTYVKTDKHANFKWGVKHKVGKKHHG